MFYFVKIISINLSMRHTIYNGVCKYCYYIIVSNSFIGLGCSHFSNHRAAKTTEKETKIKKKTSWSLVLLLKIPMAWTKPSDQIFWWKLHNVQSTFISFSICYKQEKWHSKTDLRNGVQFKHKTEKPSNWNECAQNQAFAII